MNSDNSRTKIILVAGVPRSGSTWLFNAARLLLEASGENPHSCWISSWESRHQARVHLIKAHNPAQIGFEPDVVLTTNRPTADCLTSLIRMGWLKNEPQAIRACWKSHKELYDYWKMKSTHEVAYGDISQNPAYAVRQLAVVLNIEIDSESSVRIAEELRQMKTPESGDYDPTTLLHPGHCGEGIHGGPTPSEIKRIVMG